MVRPTVTSYFLVTKEGLKVWILINGRRVKIYRFKGTRIDCGYVESITGTQFEVGYEYERNPDRDNSNYPDIDIRNYILNYNHSDQIDGHINKGTTRKVSGLFTGKYESETEERPMIFQDAAVDRNARVIRQPGLIIVYAVAGTIKGEEEEDHLDRHIAHHPRQFVSSNKRHEAVLGEARKVPETKETAKGIPFKSFDTLKDPKDKERALFFSECRLTFASRDDLIKRGLELSDDSPPPSTSGSASPRHAASSSSEFDDEDEDQDLPEQVDGLGLDDDDDDGGGSRGSASPTPDVGGLHRRAATPTPEGNDEEYEIEADREPEEQVDQHNVSGSGESRKGKRRQSESTPSCDGGGSRPPKLAKAGSGCSIS